MKLQAKFASCLWQAEAGSPGSQAMLRLSQGCRARGAQRRPDHRWSTHFGGWGGWGGLETEKDSVYGWIWPGLTIGCMDGFMMIYGELNISIVRWLNKMVYPSFCGWFYDVLCPMSMTKSHCGTTVDCFRSWVIHLVGERQAQVEAASLWMTSHDRS